MSTLQMDDLLAIVKPYNDKIIAEHKLAQAERLNVEMLAALRDCLPLFDYVACSDVEDRVRAAVAKAERHFITAFSDRIRDAAR